MSRVGLAAAGERAVGREVVLPKGIVEEFRSAAATSWHVATFRSLFLKLVAGSPSARSAAPQDLVHLRAEETLGCLISKKNTHFYCELAAGGTELPHFPWALLAVAQGCFREAALPTSVFVGDLFDVIDQPGAVLKRQE